MTVHSTLSSHAPPFFPQRRGSTHTQQPPITDFFSQSTPHSQEETVVSSEQTDEWISNTRNREKRHRYKHIPTPSITTYNTTSYSSRSTDKEGLYRRQRLVHNLTTLARQTDVVLCQETKTKETAVMYSTLLQPSHEPFKNPNPDSNVSAGTDIFVARSFGHSFLIEPIIIVAGFAQALHFYPKGEDSLFLAPFTIINVYLPSGSEAVTVACRASILSAIARLQTPSHYVFAGGDWNLTMSSSDSSGGDHFASTATSRQLLQNALDAHSLGDIYQPLHTCVRGGASPSSSRIDRVYSSHTIAEKCVMTPTAHLPPHPYPPGSRGVTDHFPVQLSFAPTGLSKKTRFKIPEWIATHPQLHSRVQREWKATRTPKKAGRALAVFKKIVKREAREMMKQQADSAKSKAASLTVAIQLHKGISTRTITHRKAESLAITDPSLHKAYHKDLDNKLEESSTTNVARHIDNIFKSHPLITPNRRKKNFLRSAKNTLPSDRKQLTHIMTDTGDRIETSEGMATALKGAWGPVWDRADPSRELIRQYLSRYTKTVQPITTQITLELVRAVISRPKDSSTGPDGIPFSLYRHLIDIAAPLIHSYIQSLSKGGRRNKTLNYTNIFFFPKDNTSRAEKTRPISVSNTDNRIIANVVRRVITPAIVDILDTSQSAFMPGRRIEDNIEAFNMAFYTALENNETYSILFHDFSKAYDSMSRDYLFTLLRQIDIPAHLITLIEALYEDVIAHPILTDPHSITIAMPNGLKQGCPLSPILFNLALDPLLTRLAELDTADRQGYCDDIGIGSSEWLITFPNALDMISEFNTATNMTSNMLKTFIITTETSPPPLSDILPVEWGLVRYTQAYKYLGVLIGPGVQVNDIFDKAWDKLEKRVARYMPLKGFYNTQNRVIIANSFLQSIFSYLFRFYMMGEDYHRDVEKLVTTWLVPANRFTYDRLTAPTRQAGLTQPLQDINHTNIVTLLRKRDTLPKPTGSPPTYHWGNGASLKITDHIQRATYLFHALTDRHPETETDQKTLNTIMRKYDPTPFEALRRKFNTRGSSNYLGPEQSRVRAKAIVTNTMSLPASLPSRIRYHVFELVHNAVPTLAREKWRGHDKIRYGARACFF